MHRLLVASTLSAGCNVVFPLRDPGPNDAPVDTLVDSPLPIPGHDEDDDDVPDVDDNCPHLPNPGQENTGDSDDVGDACDPRPSLDGDRILVFDPFTGFDGNRWETDAGDWATETDRLEQRQFIQDTPENYFLRLKNQFVSNPTVDLIIEEIATEDAGIVLKTGGGTVGFPDGASCYAQQLDALGAFSNRLVYFENRPTEPNYRVGNPIAMTGTMFPIRFRISGLGSPNGGPLCVAERPDSTAPTASFNEKPVANVELSEIGIYAYHTTAAYSSVVVYIVDPQ